MTALNSPSTIGKQETTGPGAALHLWDWLKERLNAARYVPRPRPGIVAQKFEGRNGTYYILKSPARQYIKMDPINYFLWSQMDGAATLADIAVAYFMEQHAFVFGRLSMLVASLRQKGFVEDPPTHLYGWLQQLRQGKGIAAWGDRLMQSFMQREFAVRGLDGMLSAMYNGGVRFLYHRVMLAIYWVIVAAGLVLFTQIVIQGRYAFLTTNNSVWLGILTLYGGLLITILLHEAAHAFTVKHFGREVVRGGAMIYMGQPAFFVDTKDIWMAEKKGRIAVSWAGPFMNLIMGGLLAGVIYFFPEFSLNGPLFQLATVTYVNALLNMNPLIELDGYFMLMDWLEVASLRQRSLSFIREKLFRKLVAREPFSSEERLFLVFGLLATVFTAYMVVMAAFVLQQRALPALIGLWNAPGVWGKLITGAVILVVAVPLAYSLLMRLYRGLRQAVSWLSARGVFASPRNVALLLAAPALLLHGLPWALGQGQEIAEALRPAFLLAGLVPLWLIARTYDRSYLQRAVRALGLPILMLLAAEAASLVSWLSPGMLAPWWPALVRAAGLLTFLLPAYLFFDSDNLKLATKLECGLTGLLLPASTATGVLIVTWLLAGNAPVPVAVLTGVADGMAVLSLALIISLAGSFWHSQLRYAWIYLGLSACLLGAAAVWGATAQPWSESSGGLSFLLSLGYSGLSGTILLYFLAQIRAYTQVRPVEVETSQNAPDQLTGAVQHLLESILAQYQIFFGERRLRALQDAINSMAVAARWGVAIDRGRLVSHLHSVDVSRLAPTYQQLLDQFVALLDKSAGHRFARQALQRAYDSLKWESRELANEYILQTSSWGSWLSKQFEETRHDYVALLSRIPLFYHCTRDELDAICARLDERRYAAGATLIRQGEAGDEFYIVKSGKVTVWQKDDQGWERLVNEHGRGGTFGELALLHNAPRNATCLAATPVSLLVLPRKDFELVRRYFDIKEKVDQSLHYIQILQNIPLFAETSTERLKEIAARLESHAVPAGQVVMQQGERGDRFYIVEAGQLEIFVAGGGGERSIAQRGRGEYVGEIALLLDVPRTASVRAVTPCTLLSLTREDFQALIADDLDLSQKLERVSSRRMHSLRRIDSDE